MTVGERIIHLPPSLDPYKEPSVTIELSIWQSNLDGMNRLIHFLDALQKHGGQGDVPGYFELIMHYRCIAAKVPLSTHTG